MPRIPRPSVTPFIPHQLSDTVRSEYPRFVKFLEAYYEWLEMAGAVIFRGKSIRASLDTIVFPSTASGSDHAYNGKFVYVENGPAKGHARRIVSYDGKTRTAKLEWAWEENNVPPANSRIAVRDALHPQAIRDYADVDTTLDEFVEEFSVQFLHQLPGKTLADKRKLIKRIKDFNRARGTEKSFRFLFQILFDSDAELYFPKEDLFRTSDNYWYIEQVLRFPVTEETRSMYYGWKNREIIGVQSGATARVEKCTIIRTGNLEYAELHLSNVDGTFFASTIDPGAPNSVNQLAEEIKIVYPIIPEGDSIEEPSTVTEFERPYRLLIGVEVTNGGDDYRIGDLVDITGNSLIPAKAIVTSVGSQYFTGRTGTPEEGGYYEPYFGPDLILTPDNSTFPNPLQTAQWGRHFWGDVNIILSEDEIISENEILLSQSSSNIDDFYKGFSISLTKGAGSGQTRTIISYDGINKVAVVNEPWEFLPDITTEYTIFKASGPVKAVKVIDPGLGFFDVPTVDFSPSATGSGATGVAILGAMNTAPGKFLNENSFPSSGKVLQDSYYWQDFSYDIRSGEHFERYKDVAKALLHPAGMQMFGSVHIRTSIKNRPFYTVLQEWILELTSEEFQLNFNATHTNDIQWDTFGGTAGNTLGRFDSERKFRLFYPNDNFSTQYPPPNTDYWQTGLANTQVNHFAGKTIDDMTRHPEKRFNLAGDSLVLIDNTQTVSRAGVVGASLRSLERNKFKYPPYEGFDQTYPPPNQLYWETNRANTTLGAFTGISVLQATVAPWSTRFNVVGDSYITITDETSGAPKTGNLIEYNFITGADPQIVYNVSPNSTGTLNAILGLTAATGTDDPAIVTEGAYFTTSDQLVNGEAIPKTRNNFSLVLVFRSSDMSSERTLLSNIPATGDNGFSVDLLPSGVLSFRAHNNGNTWKVQTPASTIAQNFWYMACFRIGDGIMSIDVNNTVTRQRRLVGYPVYPTDASESWIFAQPSVDYPSQTVEPGVFRKLVYRQQLYRVGESSEAGFSLNPFAGFIGYFMYYARTLENDEVIAVYNDLKSRLSGRNISLP